MLTNYAVYRSALSLICAVFAASDMSKAAWLYHLRVDGPGAYAINLDGDAKTVIENVDASELGGRDRSQLSADRHRLQLTLQPSARSREMTLRVQPPGSALRISGTRDGRALTPRDLRLARNGSHPTSVPFEIRDAALAALGAGAIPGPGLHVWVTRTPIGACPEKLTCEACQEMKALGYVDSCPCC
jgi:hypothetical protein